MGNSPRMKWDFLYRRTWIYRAWRTWAHPQTNRNRSFEAAWTRSLVGLLPSDNDSPGQHACSVKDQMHTASVRATHHCLVAWKQPGCYVNEGVWLANLIYKNVIGWIWPLVCCLSTPFLDPQVPAKELRLYFQDDGSLFKLHWVEGQKWQGVIAVVHTCCHVASSGYTDEGPWQGKSLSDFQSH